MKISKTAIACRTALFTAGFVLIFAALNRLFQPIWLEWNNYDTTHGFYEEPENTIETIFLGSSYCLNGITPMELYEDYGISAYNLASEQQPVLASYYWVEEAQRLHSESLKTVVFDVSMLRKTPKETFYRKALDGMQTSPVKFRASMAYTDDFYDGLASLFPLVSYHERWSDLTETDFTIGSYETNRSVRGYNFETTRDYFSERTYDLLDVPEYYPEYGEDEKGFEAEGAYYLKQMIDFCDENDLKLVLMRTPATTSWSVPLHNAVEKIADEYGLDFLDFNYNPLYDEIGQNHAADIRDRNHLNYYGARKLTAWFGNYLTEECGATDVRNLEGYEFLEEQLVQYNTRVKTIVTLEGITDPAEYLSLAASNEDYTIFIAAKDEASKSLTEEQRQMFATLGLSELSSLGYRDSYLAVIDGGTVTYEKSDENPSEEADRKKAVNDFDNITEEEAQAWRMEEEEVLPLSWNGLLADGTEYMLTSGGKNLGNVASCVVDGTEYADDSRGLNIVIYDNVQKKVIDTACFDTSRSSERISGDLETALETADDYTELTEDLQKLYLYNIRCEDARLSSYQRKYAKDDGLLTYLSPFMENENYAIFISAKDGDGAGADVEAAFTELGLTAFSESADKTSYMAVIAGGEVVGEYTSQGGDPINVSDAAFAASSEAGILYKLKGEENTASVTVSGTEYQSDSSGIDIIIWNMVTDMEVDNIHFDMN